MEIISTDLKKSALIVLGVYMSKITWPVSTMLLLMMKSPKVVLGDAETESYISTSMYLHLFKILLYQGKTEVDLFYLS